MPADERVACVVLDTYSRVYRGITYRREPKVTERP
jgi:hypothetical protein